MLSDRCMHDIRKYIYIQDDDSIYGIGNIPEKVNADKGHNLLDKCFNIDVN